MSQSQQVANYPMRVYFDAEVDEWVAEVVDLPGCTGAGHSASAAVDAALGFVPEWIAVAKGRGIPVAEPTERLDASGKFVVRVSKSLHARLQDRAAIEETSLNQLVVQYLSEGLSRAETTEQLLLRFDESIQTGIREGVLSGLPWTSVGRVQMPSIESSSGYEIHRVSTNARAVNVENKHGVFPLGAQTADTVPRLTVPGRIEMVEGEEEPCQNRAN